MGSADLVCEILIPVVRAGPVDLVLVEAPGPIESDESGVGNFADGSGGPNGSNGAVCVDLL